MIPILYPARELDFTTNGIGRLTDCISAVCIEERNGAYEIELTYPTNGIHFLDIATDQLIYAKPADRQNPQPFRIYKIEKNMDGTAEIYAEHISYQLNSIPVMPFKASSASVALRRLKENAAAYCPFTFWTDVKTTGSYEQTKPENIRSRLGGQDGSILDTFGGEFEWDGYNVKLHAVRGRDRGFTIRYGKNLVDLKQEESLDSMYTAVLPYWYGSVNSGDTSTNVLVTLPEELVHITTVPRKGYKMTLGDRSWLIFGTESGLVINSYSYAFDRVQILDCSSVFEEKPSVSQLREYTRQYIADNDLATPKVTLDVSFADLWNTAEYASMFPDRDASETSLYVYPSETTFPSSSTYPLNDGEAGHGDWPVKIGLSHASLCDPVTVVFEDLGIEATAIVVKTEYDILAERYLTIEIGNEKVDLASTINKLSKK